MKDILINYFKKLSKKSKILIALVVVICIGSVFFFHNNKSNKDTKANTVQSVLNDNKGKQQDNSTTQSQQSASNSNTPSTSEIKDFDNNYFNMHIDKVLTTDDGIEVDFQYLVKDQKDNDLFMISVKNTILATNSGYCTLLKFEGHGLFDIDKFLNDEGSKGLMNNVTPIALSKVMPPEKRIVPNTNQSGKFIFRKIEGVDLTKGVQLQIIIVSNGMFSRLAEDASGYLLNQAFKDSNVKYINRYEDDSKPYIFPANFKFTPSK